MRKHLLIAGMAVVLVVVLSCAGIVWRMNWMRGIDQVTFVAAARSSDPRVIKMFELDPEAEYRFNDGNRTGRRGAFAPIAQTFTLSAKVKEGYVLKLYCGIAPRIASPDGITVVEKAYAVESPTKGREADLTEEEFDAILDAKGDVEVVKPEIWTRLRLRTKNL